MALGACSLLCLQQTCGILLAHDSVSSVIHGSVFLSSHTTLHVASSTMSACVVALARMRTRVLTSVYKYISMFLYIYKYIHACMYIYTYVNVWVCTFYTRFLCACVYRLVRDVGRMFSPRACTCHVTMSRRHPLEPFGSHSFLVLFGLI